MIEAMKSVAAMVDKSPHLQYDLDKPQQCRLDFTRLQDVRRMARYIMMWERLDRLDILINTADMQPGPFGIDQSTGISTQMLVNHLGPLMFTISLLPLLRRTAIASEKNDVRIVHVNNTAHLDAPAHCRFKDITDYNQTFLNDENGDEYARYAHTKLADALFCCALQRLFNRHEQPIIVTYPHAGAVTTVGTERFRPGDESIFPECCLSPLDGALTPLWCAAHPSVKRDETSYKGQFVMPFGELRLGDRRMRDEQLLDEVFESSYTIVAPYSDLRPSTASSTSSSDFSTFSSSGGSLASYNAIPKATEPFPDFVDISPPVESEPLHCTLHCSDYVCSRIARHNRTVLPCRCGP